MAEVAVTPSVSKPLVKIQSFFSQQEHLRYLLLFQSLEMVEKALEQRVEQEAGYSWVERQVAQPFSEGEGTVDHSSVFA